MAYQTQLDRKLEEKFEISQRTVQKYEELEDIMQNGLKRFKYT